MKRVLTYSVVLSLWFTTEGQCQDATVATGGEASGSGGSVSFSVGQIAFTTNGSNYSVAEGVQQPYEISQLIGIEEQVAFNVRVFPNPTTDQVEVWLDENLQNSNCQLLASSGKLVWSGDFDHHLSLDLKGQPSGVYLLTISNKGSIQSFRIVKNQ